MGATKRGKGTKLMAMADRSGLPLAACAAATTPHEVTLVAPTLDSRFLDEVPRRLIGDRVYDADPLDAALAQLGIEMIAPHRRGRTRPKTQDGRPLRRYRRRWKIDADLSANRKATTWSSIVYSPSDLPHRYSPSP